MDKPTINPQHVAHIARLSRLRLEPHELARLAGQLESILAYVATIARADVTGVEPMAHAADLKNVLRGDDPGPVLDIEQVLQNAPDTDGRFFKVPKIIGGEEDSAG